MCMAPTATVIMTMMTTTKATPSARYRSTKPAFTPGTRAAPLSQFVQAKPAAGPFLLPGNLRGRRLLALAQRKQRCVLRPDTHLEPSRRQRQFAEIAAPAYALRRRQ